MYFEIKSPLGRLRVVSLKKALENRVIPNQVSSRQTELEERLGAFVRRQPKKVTPFSKGPIQHLLTTELEHCC